jgi:isopenicillin-N N-acyltransferase-like protein
MMGNWTTLSLEDPITPSASTDEVIYAVGRARERGLQHGRHAADKIRANLKLLDAIVADHPGISWEAIDSLIERNRPYAVVEDDELADMVAGIAEGAAIEPRLIWRLNLPAHFLLGRIPLDCSQLFIGPELTAGSFLAKTRDFKADRSFKQVAVVTGHADGSRTIAGHTAGSVTWPGSGLTSHGVAYSTSGVWSERVIVDAGRTDSGWLLFNGDLIARQARTARHFADLAAAQSRVVGINLVVADAHEAYGVELTANSASILPAAEGRLVRTNHYVTTDGEFGDIGPRTDEYASTYRRERFLEDATGKSEPVHGLHAVIDIMESAPICREAEAGSDAVSEYISVADITRGVFAIAFAGSNDR